MSGRKSKETPGQEELPLPPPPPPPSEAASAVPAPPALAEPVEPGGSDAPPSPPPPVAVSPAEDGAPIAVQFREWFLDYSSYVILDRAVPHLADGLKPVQRRVLQTLFEMDDGRYHKVAGIVGETMKLHPHGDQSIVDTLVNLAQKDLLIDRQGNFGNPLTGDGAAAPRYIEARLTPLAREVLFNPKTTAFVPSYDGRKQEPVTLPVKFPLLLALGAEGIAVGLSTKILPHHFNDLIHAAIQHLQGRRFRLLPDFPTGGFADFSEYNDGERGGRVKVRARIEVRSRYVFAITELPFGVTTLGLIESIKAAQAKGKLKVKHVQDLTAAQVEIVVEASTAADPDKFIDQLYVFTDCEVSHAPCACVIDGDRPVFTSCSEILRRSVDGTRELLRRELEIRAAELEDAWHQASLERLFIEHRVYRRIEGAESWEQVLAEIRAGLKPHLGRLRRPVTDEDLARLTEIRIKRISRYDLARAQDEIAALEKEAKQVRHHLAHLTDYAVAWFEGLRERYGKGLKRRTRSGDIEEIDKTDVVAANKRLFVNRAEGFIGTSLRGEEFVAECSELDDVICLTAEGTLKVSRVGDKVFMGADILHVALFPRGTDTTVYHLLYRDGETGNTMAKRFQVGGVTRDKAYALTRSPGSKVLHLSAQPSAGPESVTLVLDPRCSARNKRVDFDFGSLDVRGRDSVGNIVTKYPVKRVERVARKD